MGVPMRILDLAKQMVCLSGQMLPRAIQPHPVNDPG